jgi:hypothetical protein
MGADIIGERRRKPSETVKRSITMQASLCGRYIVGETVSVQREKDGRILIGRIEAIKTVNNRTLIIIAYANRHASFYDDAVNPV